MPNIIENTNKLESKDLKKDSFSWTDLKSRRDKKYQDIDKVLLDPVNIESPAFSIIHQPFLSAMLLNMKLDNELGEKLRALELISNNFSSTSLYNHNFFNQIFSNISLDNTVQRENGIVKNELNKNCENIFMNKTVAEFALATKAFCRTKTMRNMAHISRSPKAQSILNDRAYAQGKKFLLSLSPKEDVFRNLTLSPYAPNLIFRLNPIVISSKILNQELSANELCQKFKNLFDNFEMTEREKSIFTANYLASLNPYALLNIMNTDFISSLEKIGVNKHDIDSIFSDVYSLNVLPYPEYRILKEYKNNSSANPITLEKLESECPTFSFSFQLFHLFAKNDMFVSANSFKQFMLNYSSGDCIDKMNEYCIEKYGNSFVETINEKTDLSSNRDFIPDYKMFSRATDEFVYLFQRNNLSASVDKSVSSENLIKMIEDLRSSDSNVVFNSEIISLLNSSHSSELIGDLNTVDFSAVLALAYPALSKGIQQEMVSTNTEYQEYMNKFNRRYLELGGNYGDLEY